MVETEQYADISVLKDKHILVVEDNELNQLVVKTVLEQNGMQVSVAVNGLDAIKMVKNNTA